MLALTMQIDKRFGNSGFSRGADFLEHPDSSDREDLRIGWVMRKMHGLIFGETYPSIAPRSGKRAFSQHVDRLLAAGPEVRDQGKRTARGRLEDDQMMRVNWIHPQQLQTTGKLSWSHIWPRTLHA